MVENFFQDGCLYDSDKTVSGVNRRSQNSHTNFAQRNKNSNSQTASRASKIIVVENVNHGMCIDMGIRPGTYDYIKMMELPSPMIFPNLQAVKEHLISRTVPENSNNKRGCSDETDTFNVLKSFGTKVVRSQNLDGKAFCLFYPEDFKRIFGFDKHVDRAINALETQCRLSGRKLDKNPVDAVRIPIVERLNVKTILEIYDKRNNG